MYPVPSGKPAVLETADVPPSTEAKGVVDTPSSSSTLSTAQGSTAAASEAAVPPTSVSGNKANVGTTISCPEQLQEKPTTTPTPTTTCSRGEQTPCAVPVHEEKAVGEAQCGGSRSGPPTPSHAATRAGKRPPPLLESTAPGSHSSAPHTDPISKRLVSPSHKVSDAEGSPHSNQSPGPPFNHVYCMIDPQDMADSSPLTPAKGSPNKSVKSKPPVPSTRNRTGNSSSQSNPLSQ